MREKTKVGSDDTATLPIIFVARGLWCWSKRPNTVPASSDHYFYSCPYVNFLQSSERHCTYSRTTLPIFFVGRGLWCWSTRLNTVPAASDHYFYSCPYVNCFTIKRKTLQYFLLLEDCGIDPNFTVMAASDHYFYSCPYVNFLKSSESHL